MLRWCHSLSVLIALTFLLARPCAGQDVDAAPSPEARAAFDRATELYARRAYASAELEFRRSWELMEGIPRRPLVLVNIARCIEAQPGREQEALRVYQQALDETSALPADDPIVQEGRQMAEERIAEVNARLAALGRQAGTPSTETTPTTVEPSPAPAPSSGGEGELLMILGGVGLGVGAVGAALGIGFLVERERNAEAWNDDRCRSPSGELAQTCAMARDAVAPNETGGIVSLMSGSVLMAAGIVLLIVGSQADSDASAASVVCAPGILSVGCYGRF